MSQEIALPVSARFRDRWVYLFCTSGLHWLAPAALVLWGMVVAALAAYLLGLIVPRDVPFESVDTALPAGEWPDLSGEDEVAAALHSDDGDPLTLTAEELRFQLQKIAANTARLEKGEEPLLIEGRRPAEADLAAAGEGSLTQAYWSWVDDQACTLSGWSGDSRAQMAALVRNGVWACSGFSRHLAGMPSVIWLGRIPGLLLALGVLGLAGFLIRPLWFVVRRVRALHGLHQRLYGSWVARG